MYLLTPLDELYSHLLPCSQVHCELDEPKGALVQIPYLACHIKCVRPQRVCTPGDKATYRQYREPSPGIKRSPFSTF